MTQIDQIIADALAGSPETLVAIVWGSAIIWRVEAKYRAQRKADRIAAQTRTGRELRGIK